MDRPQSTTIRKAFKFRLYPTVAQAESLAFHFGAVRYVYNRYRAAREGFYQDTGESLSYYDCAIDLTQHKRETGKEWLSNAYLQSLQQSLRDLDKAYQNFFRRIKAGDLRPGYPRFKNKHGKQSMRFVFSNRHPTIADGRIRVPKVGDVKLTQHRTIEGTPKNMTVSKSKSGKFFVSIQCEIEAPMPEVQGGEIGIDLGLKAFATLSDGRSIASPQHLRKAELRLARLQRRQARKRKGSANRQKARLLVARQHERIANRRADFLHKLSRQLVDANAHIGIEDLNVKGMIRNHHLAKSISDSGWSEFVRQLEYKGEWYGCRIVKIDRWYPSSKTCGDCGNVNAGLELSDRRWVCDSCGAIHDRDVNAAQNILRESRVRTTRIDAHGDMSSRSKDAQPGNSTAQGAPPCA